MTRDTRYIRTLPEDEQQALLQKLADKLLDDGYVRIDVWEACIEARDSRVCDVIDAINN